MAGGAGPQPGTLMGPASCRVGQQTTCWVVLTAHVLAHTTHLLPLSLSAVAINSLAPSPAELDSERKSPLHHVPIGAGQAGLAARRGANHAQVSCA